MESIVNPRLPAKPYISIVMAIMNVAEEFKKTLDGLDRQEFKSFELLVADCNSTDDPARYIANRPYPIFHYVQADEGIYDAWNKVLPYARGEWVIFMGAGDTFHHASSLRKAVDYLLRFDEKVLMAYGQVNVIGENGKVLTTIGKPWDEIFDEIINFGEFPHQATFQRTRSFNEFGLFDKRLTIVADKDMIFRLASVVKPVFFPVLLSNFLYGGVSNAHQSKEKTIRQHIDLCNSHGYRLNTIWVEVKLFAMKAIRGTIGDRSGDLMTDLYRQFTGRARRFK